MNSFIEKFAVIAKEYAKEIALVDNDGSRRTTYAELDSMMRRVAAKIISLNLKTGTPVIVNMERCREYVASYLGTLAAGCAVVPLTPEYPKARVEFIEKDCGAGLVITEDFFNDIDDVTPADIRDVAENTPACIVYTSGSTGFPKGVLHDVNSFCRMALGKYDFLDMDGKIVYGATCTFSFALSLYDVYRPLVMGAEVHIISDFTRKDSVRLAEYFEQHKITLGCVSYQLLKNFKCKSKYLRRVYAGGERMCNVYSPDYEIVNVYGSSELGLVSCFKVDKPCANTPIGNPFPECSFVVSDKGELCVEGRFSDCYLNLPEKTAEVFERLPDGNTRYHTGDLVTRDEKGNYFYQNRMDWMVKVNGQRVETQEIESVLKLIGGVDNGAVKAFVDEDGQNYLVAYYVCKKGFAEILEPQIRADLAKKLPPYMIPRFIVKMESLPLTISGKLDRVSLEAPSIENYKVFYRAPENAVEIAVCETMGRILHCGRVGLDDDFFALGGDSIKVMKLVAELDDAGFVVLASDVLKGRTAEKVAASATEHCVNISVNTSIPEITPLTESQRGVYFESAEKPLSTMYNIPFALDLPDSIDLEKFEDAVKTAALMHPALFVTVSNEMGEPAMFFHEPECTVSKTSAATRKDAFAHFVKPFNLEEGPLYRFEICKVPEGTLFLMDVHHLVFDGTSVNVLLNQIANVYAGGNAVAESCTLFDASREEYGLKISRKYKAARQYFKTQFDGFEWEEMLLPDVAENSIESKESAGIVVSKPGTEWNTLAVENFVRKTGVTESTFFMAAFAYALSLFGGTSSSNFITVNSGRHDARLMNAVGMFVKTLPLRFDIPESSTVAEFLKEVQEKLFNTMEHDCISFGELMRSYGIRFDVSFVYQSSLLSEIKFGESSVLPEELPVNDCQSNVVGMLLKTEKGYEMHTHYKSSLYSRKFIESLNETVFEIAKGMLSCERLSEIQVASESARQFIDRFNDTDLPRADFTTVNQVFNKVVKARADKTALVFKEKQYTFAELDCLTRNLAAFVNGKNIGREDFVAILVPRSDSMVIAAWGVIRAGAAFQPLDPTYPAERLNYMVNDSKAKLLIADRSLVGLLNEYKGDVLFTDEMMTLADAPDFSVNVNPEDALTMIYTSGTTGKPKGCVLENRNMAAFFRNHCQIMEIDEETRFASYASFGFDAGVTDVVCIPMAGGALYIVPDEIRLDLDKLNEYFCENGITHGFMTTQLGRMFAEQTKCKTLKVFIAGGEKLVPFNPPKNFRFVNGYGPCETIAYICHHDVCDNSSIQPIGTPSGDTKLYVCDKFERMLPVGAMGELYISGTQVGRGYLGIPEKTASVFVENPFTANVKYSRMYKTGDVVRLLPQGEIEYIGRRDGQVKVRGFRIELTEVEEVIRRYDGITDATVAAFDDPAGGKYLAAYVVSKSKVDVQKLNDFICAEKPAYMVPATTMQIDAIPYNQNQKVNRRALPEPKRGGDACENKKSETETQQKIFDVVAEILGHDNFGVDTNLFYAGLTSISTLKLNLELSKAFNKPIKISDVKENNTVRMLEKFFGLKESSLMAMPAPVAADLDNAHEKRASYPLMQNQMGVFVECQVNSDSVDYNIPTLFKISEKLDLEKLKKAIVKAINAHPYIKTTLATDKDGNVCALRHDDVKPIVETIELAELPLDAELGAYLIKPFTLIGNPLYRIKIFKTQKGNFLFMDVHHIISDGTSLAVLLDAINRAYAGEEIEAESYTGFEAALEEMELRASTKLVDSEKYYEKLLSGCNTECMPAKCPGEGFTSSSDSAQESSLVAEHFYASLSECSASITEFCKKHNITQNAFFNAVFSFTLSKFIHNESVSYCTVYNGRNDSRLFESFAMLVKTLPVACDIDEKASVISLVESMQNQLMDSMANDIYSFAEISNKFGVKSDIFFNYQGDNFNFDNIGGEQAKLMPLDANAAKAPISFEMFLENGTYRLDVTFCIDCFCKEFVESFVGAFVQAACSFTRCETLNQVSLFSEAERKTFALMNATNKPFENVPAHSLIEYWAKKTPEKIAVKTANASLTFLELDAMANRVANSLLKLNVGKENIVGLILDRSELVPVAEIGIMKANGAFLPMLPTYPDDRLDYCMQNADCKYVIANRDVVENRKELFAEGKPYKALILEDIIATGSLDTPVTLDAFSPDQLAYCIYTSGSTGTPKGVMIEQHNLSNFVQTAGLKEIEENGSAILCMASISFDMSISEIFFSLCQGKTAYIASEEEIHNLDKLQTAFVKNHIDIMMMTPSFAWSLLSLPEFGGAIANLQGVTLGAEAFQPTLYAKLKALNPDMVIQNGYGPTECTQACSAKTLTSGENITIGRPFANTKFYVMDSCGNLLPRYAVGELIICGEGVGRGYVKLPEKTSAAFFEIEGVRAYRSGDLVRINRYNEVEFGGRADNQVKLRGFRVELDEVEAVMQEFDGVTQSKVIVRNNGTEDFLAAYFTAETNVSVEDLTAFMKKKLTYYMVPAAMMQLDKMPMTANGKLDKKALPEIRPAAKMRKKRVPKKSLEENILDVFRSVLGIEDCYCDDNFFEVGGTSLSASKAVMQLKSAGHKIEYQDIFDHQTAEELAEYLEMNGSLNKDSSASASKDDGVELVHTDSEISEVLKFNSMEFAADVERKPLGTVVLTGATGFLGVHVLRELLDTETGRIYCLMRKGHFEDAVERLKTTLVYYFEDEFNEAFKNRITVLEGDITDEKLSEIFKDVSFDTLINCAACVKHFSNDSSIEFVNVHGVENLINLCKAHEAKMIQISTTSVPGAHNAETYKVNLRMPENQLFVVDDMNNQYGKSKYKAELLMFKAIKEGLRGKVLRAGNLMGRASDGEFQTNARTNAFLNALRGFVAIGKCPISHSTDPMSFSPIDSTAKAMVLLSGTNDKFTAFNVDSRWVFDEMKLLDVVNHYGIKVKAVEDKEYYDDFYRMMGDPAMNEKVSALLTNDRPDIHIVNTENRFTANVLYRLGFSWPFVDNSYLEKVICSLDTLDFFS